jgi:hypothetical protein
MTTKSSKALSEEQQKLWDVIKDIKINYYGLKEHFVHTVCSPVNIVPDKLYLIAKGPAVISSISEALLSDEFCVKTGSGKMMPKYIVDYVEEKLLEVKENPDIQLKDFK